MNASTNQSSGQGAMTIAAGGLSGGLGSVIGGGDFWEGARNGLIVSSLNHGMHMAATHIEAGIYVRSVRRFLEDLGHDAAQVKSDVVKQVDAFYGKYYAKLENFSSYESSFTGGYADSRNGTTDPYLSLTRTVVTGTSGCCETSDKTEIYALKYYPSREHSIGLTRVGFDHKVEAFYETLDGGWRWVTGQDNVIYDMHRRNAERYLRYR